MIKELFNLLCDVFVYALLVYIILGWFANARQWSLYHSLDGIFDPMLAPLRKILPMLPLGASGGLDLSPIVLVLLLNLIQNIINAIL